MRALPRAARLACALLALAAGLAGCGRHPRVEYPGADSLATAATDSSLIRVREAQQAWEVAGGGEAAARATAALVTGWLPPDLPEQWGSRTQGFLDSLGIGAEIAADTRAMAVNFFSRSDPADGSWPHLFWNGRRGVESRPIDGGSMRLLKLASRGLGVGARNDTTPAAVALLFDRRARLGTEPYLMLWALRGDRWDVAQTLGPDSLGGAGTGEFVAAADSVTLVTRTYRTSRGFDECPTCPHVFHVRRFLWGRDGFERLGEEEAPSPYSAFVRFVQALQSDDRAAAEALVTDRALADAARRAGFGQSRGLWRVAPSTDETATHMVFLRGTTEAYDVSFEQRGGAWLVDGIETTQQHLE
jgi:hypothetical protein